MGIFNHNELSEDQKKALGLIDQFLWEAAQTAAPALAAITAPTGNEADRNRNAVNAMAKAMGLKLDLTKMPAGDLLLLVNEMAGGDHKAPVGSVVAVDIWTDPPVVLPMKPFDLVWREQNTGFGETGDYVTQISINGVEEPANQVKGTTLAPEEMVERRFKFASGLEGGSYPIRIYTPWSGDPNATIPTQAGRTSTLEFKFQVGIEEIESEQDFQKSVEINTAVQTAYNHMEALVAGGTPIDVNYVDWALQAIAKAAPDLDQQLDLLQIGSRTLARNPATIDPAAIPGITGKAKDAAVALKTAETRLLIEGVDPVDHPDVEKAAEAIIEVALAIIEAPSVADSGAGD